MISRFCEFKLIGGIFGKKTILKEESISYYEILKEKVIIF